MTVPGAASNPRGAGTRGREDDPKQCPLPRLALDLKSAAVAVHDVLHDRQPKACSALAAACSHVDTVEPLREPRQMLVRDAWTIVANGQLHLARATRQGDVHLAACPPVFNGVFDEVL